MFNHESQSGDSVSSHLDHVHHQTVQFCTSYTQKHNTYFFVCFFIIFNVFWKTTSPMKLHHSNHCHPKTLQHCCHSCRAFDSLVCVGSRALFVIGSWRFHWQVRKRSRSILTDVRRRCILKMGLPDVGWRSADI